MSPRGWVIATAEGVVHESPEGWKLWRPNSGTVLRFAWPLKEGGWVVAGDAFCSLVSVQGDEQSLPVRGQITSGLVGDNIAVVVSADGVWAVGRAGVVAEIAFAERQARAMVAAIEGRPIIFNANDEVWEFDEKSL